MAHGGGGLTFMAFEVDPETGERRAPTRKPGKLTIYKLLSNGEYERRSLPISPTISHDFLQLFGSGWIVESAFKAIQEATDGAFREKGTAAAPTSQQLAALAYRRDPVNVEPPAVQTKPAGRKRGRKPKAENV